MSVTPVEPAQDWHSSRTAGPGATLIPVSNTGNTDVWLVIPAYNEGPVIADVIAAALGTFPNIVCVDDGSVDRTAALAHGAGAHVVRHPVNLGQGAAIQTGVEYARAQPGAQIFVTFDADGQRKSKTWWPWWTDCVWSPSISSSALVSARARVPDMCLLSNA